MIVEEPNQQGNEDCIVTWTDNKWNDLSCNSKLPFVCMRKLSILMCLGKVKHGK